MNFGSKPRLCEFIVKLILRNDFDNNIRANRRIIEIIKVRIIDKIVNSL